MVQSQAAVAKEYYQNEGFLMKSKFYKLSREEMSALGFTFQYRLPPSGSIIYACHPHHKKGVPVTSIIGSLSGRMRIENFPMLLGDGEVNVSSIGLVHSS